MTLLIGLTGDRGVGKSEVVKIFEGELGFRYAHSFGPGKAMVEGYLRYMGADELIEDEIYAYVHGGKKDIPCPYLPLNASTGSHYSTRYFMEELGHWMPSHLGVDWTLTAALKRASETVEPDQGIINDSIVYEDELFRRRGGHIIRVMRSSVASSGHRTSKVQHQIKTPHWIVNDGPLDELKRAAFFCLHGLLIDTGKVPTVEHTEWYGKLKTYVDAETAKVTR